MCNRAFRKDYVSIETKFNTKYTSNNPLVVFLNNHFLSELGSYVRTIEGENALDVGCGEGIFTQYLVNRSYVAEHSLIGLDVEPQRLRLASDINPGVQFNQGSIYEIPYRTNAFELVMALEVLEHLEFPEKAIAELARVSKQWVLISIPNDRMFRLGNMLRFKYIDSWGNPPSHLQHWNKRTFRDLVARHLNIVKVNTPMQLWLVFLCQKRNKNLHSSVLSSAN